MSAVRRLTTICTGMHTYDKGLSVRGRGGERIRAPILAYLIETDHGRILYDVGCDHAKLADPQARAAWYDAASFPFGPPEMAADERLPVQLARLGLNPRDIDAVVLGHLHFDHAGGLSDFAHAEVHCHPAEFAAAQANRDGAYFASDWAGHPRWKLDAAGGELCPGVRLIDSPGHTAGHRSLWIELRAGAPVLIAGDAADLAENLDDEIAPGLLWDEREDLALASIRALKGLAADTGAELWPNHDLAHWQRQCRCGRPVLASPTRLAEAA